MVNCNPETVSTDYDTSDRLYFEPLTLEDVLEIVHVEKPFGVIVQYGGQTPLKLARDLEKNGVPIIGTSPDMIDMAEDRERFQQMLHRLELKQPPNRTARTEDDAMTAAEEIGYPLVVRPVVRAGRPRDGDRPRAAATSSATCARRSRCRTTRRCCSTASSTTRSRSTSTRCATARDVVIGGIMEHIEQAGVHSGDSACSLPPYSLSARDAGRAAPADRGDGARPVRRRPDERPVRDPERHRVRARGESARVADRAVRVEGDRPSRSPRSPRAAWSASRSRRRASRARSSRRTSRSRKRCFRSSSSRASTRSSGRR